MIPTKQFFIKSVYCSADAAKRVFVVALVVITLFVFGFSIANAQIPFGGPVLTIIPCDVGLWVTVGPPIGGSFMWIPGTISYAMGPPIHPGQFLLGMAGPPMVCVVGFIPVGAGLTILYHGSSI